MNKANGKCPIHNIPGVAKIMRILSDFGQRIGYINEPNWQHHISDLESLANNILTVFHRINLQGLWDLTLEYSASGERTKSQALFHLINGFLSKEFFESDLIDKDILDYYGKQYFLFYGKKMTDEEIIGQIASMFAIAFADIIAIVYLQNKLNFPRNKALGLIYGNMNGGNAQIESLLSSVILGDASISQNTVDQIKMINNSGRQHACPFYLSSMRQDWVNEVYKMAEEIVFSKL